MSTDEQDEHTDAPDETHVNINDKSDDYYNKAWNKYKSFDKKKTKQIMFYCKLAMFIVASSFCIASFMVPVLKKAKPVSISLWQWSLLVTVLLGGPLVSEGIAKIADKIFNKYISVTKKDWIYYVLGLVESAWVGLWFTMVLIAWLYLVKQHSSKLKMTKSDKKIFGITVQITSITILTLILGSILWLLKDLVIMKAESRFLITRFFDRIQVALMKQVIIRQLNKQLIIGNEPGDGSLLSKVIVSVTQENVSSWAMDQGIRFLIENPHLTYEGIRDGSPSKVEIIDRRNALTLAKDLFNALLKKEAMENSHIIGQEVLRKYLHNDKRVVSRYLFDQTSSKGIDQEYFTKWMIDAQQKHAILAHALLANKNLFKSLNKFINVFLLLLIIALWLLMLKHETRKFIIYFGITIAGAAFLYGDACKRILDNLLFVFLVHPYDTGDCCVINNTPVIIKELNVLSTTAITLDNELRYYPNSQLAGQTIGNYTRSNHMGDFIEFALDVNTKTNTIDDLREQVKRYIEKHPNDWDSEHDWEMEFGDLDNMEKIKMKLHVLHTIDYHDFKKRQTRKYELASHIKMILNDLKPRRASKDDSNSHS